MRAKYELFIKKQQRIMKSRYLLWGIIILFSACQSKTNNKKQESSYSLVMDYFQNKTLDTTTTKETEGYIPYPRLNIAGNTLTEVVKKYGVPESNYVFDLELSQGYEEGTLYDVLSYILQNFDSPVRIHVFRWLPYKNKDFILSVYFIACNDTLRVIYGDQLNDRQSQLE